MNRSVIANVAFAIFALGGFAWGARLYASNVSLHAELGRLETASRVAALQALKDRSDAEHLAQQRADAIRSARAEQEKRAQREKEASRDKEAAEIKDLTSVYQQFLFDYEQYRTTPNSGTYPEIEAGTKKVYDGIRADLRELETKVVDTDRGKGFQDALRSVFRTFMLALDEQEAVIAYTGEGNMLEKARCERVARGYFRSTQRLLASLASNFDVSRRRSH